MLATEAGGDGAFFEGVVYCVPELCVRMGFLYGMERLDDYPLGRIGVEEAVDIRTEVGRTAPARRTCRASSRS